MKEGWEIRKLGEVCNFFNDGNWIESKDQSENGYRLIQTGNVGIGEFRNKSGKERYISKETFKKLKCIEIFEGDILVSRLPDPVGRTCVVPLLGQKMITAVDCSIIRLNKNILSNDYFKYYSQSQSYFKSISEKITGTTRDRISRSNLGFVTIPIPQLTEQQHIISILDDAFTAIDQAKENIQRNLQNAKELFQSELHTLFANRTGRWLENKLGNVTTKIGSGATPRGGNESYKTEGIGLVRSMNVHDRYFKEKNLAFIDDKQAKELSNVTLEENDVLLNITGASVARCCVIPKEYLPARVNQHVSIIRPKKDILHSTFLNLLLTSKFYKDQLLETGEQGATRQAITKAQLTDFVIHYPSLKDQQQIVDQLNILSTETKKLEEMYQQKLNHLEALKKSILQKAFNGELTQELEIIKPVQLPTSVPTPVIKATDLHAGLIALSLKLHDDAGKLKTFHHVKSEKIIHLIEYHVGIDLGRNPVKDAAGPNDYPTKMRVEGRAKKANYFSVETSNGIKSFVKGNQFETLIDKTTKAIYGQFAEIEKLITLIIPMNTQQAEIVATVYAGWNNLLLDKLETTDEAIVFEARENWHANKLTIPRDKFFKAITWMKNNNLVPKGTGKKVLKKHAAN